jgi:hypothetical protein
MSQILTEENREGVFLIRESALNTNQAFDFLSKFNEEVHAHVSRLQGLNCKGAELYFFYTKDTKRFNDYSTDDYSWVNDGGKKKLPVNNPIVYKSYYKIKDFNNPSKGLPTFQRNIFQLISNDNNKEYFLALVHYFGDEKVYQPRIHGNRKVLDNVAPYIRTPPSVLNEIKSLVESNTAVYTYQNAPTSIKPRNMKQCQNAKYAVNKNKRITHDEIVNTFILHTQLGFPNYILVAPDVRMVCVYDKLALEVRKTLRSATKMKICFQYDTTFDLSGYYVSVLTMIHPYLLHSDTSKGKSCPFPVAYFLHEKKHEEAHNFFFSVIKTYLPEIDNHVFFVTDCEMAFRNAIMDIFPSAPLYRCWKHLWGSIKDHLKYKFKYNDGLISRYLESCRELFLQPTKQQFDKCLQQIENGECEFNWSDEFNQYYLKNVHKDRDSIAAYSVRDTCGDLFNWMSGVTTNQSEGLNNLYKTLLKRTTRPIDIVTNSFYKMSQFYLNEIKLGFGNRGNYCLKSEHRDCFVDASTITIVDLVDPEKLITELLQNPQKFNMVLVDQQYRTEDTNVIEISDNIMDTYEPVQETDKITIDTPQNDLIDDCLNSQFSVAMSLGVTPSTSDQQTQETLNPIRIKSKMNCKISRAINFVKSKRVKLDEETKQYRVIDDDNKSYYVELFPSIKCMCLEGKNCSHILAVKYFNGDDIESQYKIANMGTLIQKKNGNQKTGHKSKGHTANAINLVNEKVIQQNIVISETDNDEMIENDVQSKLPFDKAMLCELVLDKAYITQDIINKSKQLSEEVVKVVPDDLTDSVLKESFDVELYKSYFDADAWSLVTNLIAAKKTTSTCIDCGKYCLCNKSICCSFCSRWYHAKCQKISPSLLTYHQGKKGSKWKCSSCKNRN